MPGPDRAGVVLRRIDKDRAPIRRFLTSRRRPIDGRLQRFEDLNLPGRG
jgi:hypothetical protein